METATGLAVSQGMLAATWSWRRQKSGFSSKASGGSVGLLTTWYQPSDADLGHLASRVWESKFLLFWATQHVVFCYSSHRRLMPWFIMVKWAAWYPPSFKHILHMPRHCPSQTDLQSGVFSTFRMDALLCSLSRVWLFVTPWTAARQPPLSVEFSRQKYWSGLPFPIPGESSQPRDQTRVSCISYAGR